MKEWDKKTQRRITRDIRLLLACAILAAGIYIVGNIREDERTSSDSVQRTEEASGEKEVSQDVSAGIAEDGDNSLEGLRDILENLISRQSGEWSIYVKDLEEEVSLTVQNTSLYAASLIKLFVMEKTFLDFDQVAANVPEGDETGGEEHVLSLLANMIERSDNESFNELVRLQSEDLDFAEGCVLIDKYLGENGYRDTAVYHSLSPSATGLVSIGDAENCTSVKDCGLLLEKIYQGTCVSQEASERMLDMLRKQETVNKIPEGVPENIQVANKTGETDEVQHDAAIVYGPQKDYILCVMSKDSSGAGKSIQLIQQISRAVYEYLNPENSQ